MEASALAAVAAFRGVPLARVVYCGDDLAGEPWDHRSRQSLSDVREDLFDLAATAALDCLADIATVRAAPAVYGLVASDPTVSRTIDALAADAPAALAAINQARATARAQVWTAAGAAAPDHDVRVASPVVVDVDATLVTAHSDKQDAAPTFKRGYGHHPLCAFVDHGPDGTGEPLAMHLRPGNAGSNTAADHVVVLREALRQLPSHQPGRRPGKKVLVRVDGAGATHASPRPSQRLRA